MINVTFRPVAEADWEQVLTVERLTSTGQVWGRHQFDSLLSEAHTFLTVCVYRKRVIAYVLYRNEGDSTEVLALAVLPAYQRQGIATRMLLKLCHRARTLKKRCLYFTVRESNRPMLNLCKKLQLFSTKLLREHYEDTSEDGICFVFDGLTQNLRTNTFNRA